MVGIAILGGVSRKKIITGDVERMTTGKMNGGLVGGIRLPALYKIGNTTVRTMTTVPNAVTAVATRRIGTERNVVEAAAATTANTKEKEVSATTSANTNIRSTEGSIDMKNAAPRDESIQKIHIAVVVTAVLVLGPNCKRFNKFHKSTFMYLNCYTIHSSCFINLRCHLFPFSQFAHTLGMAFGS